MTIVMKFGGTSMGDAERIRGCAALVREQAREHRVVAVVSAMAGVTDMLIELAAAAAAGNRAAQHMLLGKLREKHEHAARALSAADRVSPLLDRLETLASGIAAVGELTPRSRDHVLSFGERLSAELMAAAAGARALTGQEAGIVTDENFGEAEPLMDLTLYQVKETLDPLLTPGRCVVVTGFIAATQHGVTTTLGRGGSDYTATILGAALKADEIWIWSDVDGIMSANPKVVPQARLLSAISFGEAIEMGQFGAKSMHPRALEPAAEHRIPVRMRNTFNPSGAGTLISESGEAGHVARAVLSVSKAALVTVAGAAMIGRPGTAARIFRALADENVNILMISQSVSEAGISFVVAGSQLERARGALQKQLLRTGDARHIDVLENVAVVALVGSGMRGTPGVAARLFGAVARRSVNVMAIAQGSSEISVSFVVRGEDGAEAVRGLHEEFELG
ncbi:Bifunctional aspartokinase/homoserine dehydrogenase 1 [Phycisphaerae bacterium RAS1]|nr:Bifunctional aspartokinase/homoserine dehydrogenase 1 [Phycisphaerae bacterium RAS1]